MNKRLCILIATLFLTLNCFATARATLLVNNTNDSGAGSLRDAIDYFNNDISGIDNAIIFSNVFNVPQKINLASQLSIGGFGGSLTIVGPSANLLTLHMAGIDRIFRSTTALKISGMTLEFGQGRGSAGTENGKGSAIYFSGISGGSLTLDGVVVQNNDSTSLPASSGAIYFFGGASHRITNSTFTGNTSGNCGAFDGQGYTLTVVNSTISGNTVLNFGGGLCVPSGSTTFRSSTIASNTSVAGGGIFVQSGTLNLGNTIVAGNTGGSFPDFRYFGGVITTAGGNLIGNNSDVASIFPVGVQADGDRAGDPAAPLDASLAPLGNYGGPTLTRALCAGSPAIDHAFPVSGDLPAQDQRGGSRDFFYDIGAFEFNAGYVGVLPFVRIAQPFIFVFTPNSNGFNYCIASGSLPPGVTGIPNCPVPRANGYESLSPQGASAAVAISGTPTATGNFNFAIRASSGVNSSTTNYELTVAGPSAANGAVTGRIVDGDGNPLEGAVVKLEGRQERKSITMPTVSITSTMWTPLASTR